MQKAFQCARFAEAAEAENRHFRIHARRAALLRLRKRGGEAFKKRVEVGRRERGGFRQKRRFPVAVDGELRRIFVDFGHEDVAEMGKQIREDGCRFFAALQNGVEGAERFRIFAAQDVRGEREDFLFSRETEQVIDERGRERGVPGGAAALVEQRERIAEPAFRADGEEVGRFVRERKFVGFGDFEQMFLDVFGGNAAELIALAAGENRQRDFFRLGRRQDKKHMGRRLFQRFQKRVKSLLRQHVHFIDDIDFLFANGGE